MKKFIYFCLCLGMVFLLLNLTFANETKPKSLEAVEFFTGFGSGDLRENEDYCLIPFFVDFDFNLKPLIQKLNLKPRQLVQFQIEPFISPVFEPDVNIEIGTSFLLKIGLLPQTSKFQPYVKGGVGMLYMTQHTREQGTQFNFVEYAGAGMHYFFRKNIAFTLEGRARHLSNAGIKEPNKGIDSYFALAGISYQF